LGWFEDILILEVSAFSLLFIVGIYLEINSPIILGPISEGSSKVLLRSFVETCCLEARHPSEPRYAWPGHLSIFLEFSLYVILEFIFIDEISKFIYHSPPGLSTSVGFVPKAFIIIGEDFVDAAGFVSRSVILMTTLEALVFRLGRH
jgi:hypothetical protein